MAGRYNRPTAGSVTQMTDWYMLCTSIQGNGASQKTQLNFTEYGGGVPTLTVYRHLLFEKEDKMNLNMMGATYSFVQCQVPILYRLWHLIGPKTACRSSSSHCLCSSKLKVASIILMAPS